MLITVVLVSQDLLYLTILAIVLALTVIISMVSYVQNVIINVCYVLARQPIAKTVLFLELLNPISSVRLV